MATISAARLDYEQARRGLTTKQLAELAHISEPGLSRLKHGRPCRPATLRALAAALEAAPIDAAIDRLLTVPA